ncbi:MAG TPA: hypothetical protein VIK54_02950 [Acidimicrobiia bacterium]
MTRSSRAIALTALVAFAFATPLGGRALGRACAAGDVHVAVVVDSGGSAVSAVCVPGGSDDNGATILAARAAMLGTPQPRYSASGLLCAIDGVPSTGCGVAHDGHYAYWSYWHGDGGKWSYANVGPASGRADPGVVEGWRWQPDGSALPTDPPPRGPADATAICAPVPPRPTAPPTTVASPSPPTVAPATRPSVSGGAQQEPSTPPATGPHSSRPVSPPARRGSAVAVTTATTAGGSSSSRAPGESSSSSIAISVRGIAAAPPGRSAGGAPVGLLVGVSLVVALGAGGAIAQRRRRPAS